jgi:hypothetical protein
MNPGEDFQSAPAAGTLVWPEPESPEGAGSPLRQMLGD